MVKRRVRISHALAVGVSLVSLVSCGWQKLPNYSAYRAGILKAHPNVRLDGFYSKVDSTIDWGTGDLVVKHSATVIYFYDDGSCCQWHWVDVGSTDHDSIETKFRASYSSPDGQRWSKELGNCWELCTWADDTLWLEGFYSTNGSMCVRRDPFLVETDSARTDLSLRPPSWKQTTSGPFVQPPTYSFHLSNWKPDSTDFFGTNERLNRSQTRKFNCVSCPRKWNLHGNGRRL